MVDDCFCGCHGGLRRVHDRYGPPWVGPSRRSAAIRGRAELIVTLNPKDFPDDLLDDYELHAVAPYDFFLDLWDSNQGDVTEALHSQAKRKNNPALTVGDVLGRLTQFAPGFCEAVVDSDPGIHKTISARTFCPASPSEGYLARSGGRVNRSVCTLPVSQPIQDDGKVTRNSFLPTDHRLSR